MPKRIQIYVAAVSAGATLAALAVAAFAPVRGTDDVLAAACLGGLGLLAQLLSHKVRQGTAGSIASIPYLAAVAVSPTWGTLSAITIAALAVECSRRTGFLKTVFNVSQLSLASSTAIGVFRALGGISLLEDQSFQLVPYAAMVFSFFLINTLSVSAAIALSEGRELVRVWKHFTGGTFLYDLLASPLVYLFGWVYVSYGGIWAAGLALPMLGIRQIFKTNRQLEQINQDLLQLMVAAIEARDPYTSGHSRRVAHYAKIIARAMGMGARQVDRVGIAALLHDVGKIHEQYAPILRKPDKLTLEERLVIQTHPLKSAELVSNVSQLKDVVAPIRHHHENWDGTGYPDGLAGEEIPVSARIIMIADTIDAMTTDRPYRRALDEEAVRSELHTLSGKQFDPEITEILLRSPLYKQLFFASSRITPRYTPILTPGPIRKIGSH